MRQPTFKCDVCNKRLQSSAALVSHRKVHNVASSKPKSKSNLTNLLGKPVGQPRKKVEENPHVTDLRKIEYECPICFTRFSTHFSTSRHIQKVHRTEVSQRPERVETCLKCNSKIVNQEQHLCTYGSKEMLSAMENGCICMGCRKVFQTVESFDVHVSSMHSDCVQTLLFPTIHEFTQWKEQMESQIKVKFLIMGSCSNRQTYHCTHIPLTQREDNLAQFCPASIVVREYSKSIQVHFYRDHQGHSCEYKLPDKYKKYLMTEMMKRPIPISYSSKNDDEKLYPKFKTLMTEVIAAALNADTDTLKLLYDKALEMTKIVKENEPLPPTKNMTDEQITETLESMNNGKAKSETDSKSAKEETAKEGSTKIKLKKVSKPIFNASPKICFNDSYKEFVNKNFIKPEEPDVKKSKKIKPEPDVKNSKKLKPEPDVKNSQKIKPEPDVKNSQKIKPEPDVKNSKKIKISPAVTENVSKTVIKSVKVDKSGKIVKSNSKNKKKVMKTKIGQFKPGLSPNKPQITKTEVKESGSPGSGRLSVDINYEVIEQENDCNILVLKI